MYQPKERTLPLPVGWQAVLDNAIGVTYFDETGRVVFQHPYDTDAAIMTAVQIYRSMKERAQ